MSSPRIAISVRDLWDGINPDGFEMGIFVILRGYIDESGDGKDIFTLSSLIGHGETWFYLQEDWLKCLAEKNKALRAQGRKELSRYHASDCSSCLGEFKGWTVNPEQIEFSKQLLSIMEKYRLDTLAYTVRLSEMVQKIPETSKNPLGFAYVLLLPFVMTEIGEFTLRHSPAAISLIHDRCDYDVALLQMFNQVIGDLGFEFRESFTTLAPMCWQHCIPLQPADLMAYENFKEGERHIGKPRGRRKSLERLVSRGQIGGKLCLFDARTLGLLKERMDSMSPIAKELILEIGAGQQTKEKKRSKI